MKSKKDAVDQTWDDLVMAQRDIEAMIYRFLTARGVVVNAPVLKKNNE